MSDNCQLRVLLYSCCPFMKSVRYDHYLKLVLNLVERIKILPNEAVGAYDKLANELGKYISDAKLNPFIRLPRLMTW